ncbi:patatin-like phospholipase family protein [Larkinella soli]|uniref:patatin-like phospholipase family protein n=1 Tax=Larkinella soli TaxID=1770527 RepID=UPI000FFCB70F|nr:patatin-like phospholipase family protein [Larkinella soli]
MNPVKKKSRPKPGGTPGPDFRQQLFGWIYTGFKYFQAVLTVTSPLIVALFLLVAGYLVFSGSDQFTDLLVAMLNDWWYTSAIRLDSVRWAVFVRDGAFLIALCVWAFSLAFGSRWVLLKTRIRSVPLREEYEYLRPSLEKWQNSLLRYAPRTLAFLPFGMVAWAFFHTSQITQYRHPNVWYWILVLLGLGAVVSTVLLTLIHQQLMSDGAGNRSDFGNAVTSRNAHGISEFPMFRRWIVGLAVLNLTLTFFFGFVHRLIEGLSGGNYPTRFDLATTVGFGTIFVSALAGWGFLLMWFRYQLRSRAIPLLGFVVVFALLVYALGINIRRREIRTLPEAGPLTRPSDSTYVDRWLIDRSRDAGPDIPVFIVAAEGGGSRAAQWTAGVLARLDADLPGFRRHLLAISGVSGGSVGAGFYASWLYNYPQQKNIRSALDSLTSADFLSGLIGAFCYPDPITSFVPGLNQSPLFDRARWLEDRFADHFYYKTGKLTLTEGFTRLAAGHPDLPLLLLNSTVVETGKKAILSPIAMDSSFFYGSRDVLGEVGKDIPLMTAMSLSARFPVVTPAGTVYGPNRDRLSYRLVDGGYFENTGMQTAYQMLQLVVKRREMLNGRLNGKQVRPMIIFIENGDSRTADTLQATTGFAPLAAFYKAWDNRTPSLIGDMKYFIRQSIAPDGFQVFRLTRPDARVIPLGWYLSETARQAINDQVQAIHRDTSYTNLRKALGLIPQSVRKSKEPEKRITEQITY